MEEDIYKVIIIGSGPAGLSAAIYASRAGLSPLLLTGMTIGGQAATTDRIENYPGFPEGIAGSELTHLMQEQAKRFGAQVVFDEVTAVDLSAHPLRVETYGKEYAAKALIVATGVSPRRLGVPGEEELIGRGVSFCATCDGPFYRDKGVVVVGGGNSAVEEALFLTRFASKVHIVHRRDRLRADRILQERAERNERIEFVWNSVVTEILGDAKVTSCLPKRGEKHPVHGSGETARQVTGVRLKNVNTGEESVLDADGVFVYIGSVPNTQLFAGQLELDERGYIVTDERQRTSVKGVFAAGDVQERVLQQVATAVGSGAKAAMEAERFIAELEGRGYPGWA